LPVNRAEADAFRAPTPSHASRPRSGDWYRYSAIWGRPSPKPRLPAAYIQEYQSCWARFCRSMSFAEWIELWSWSVQSRSWALSCNAPADHPSIQRDARRFMQRSTFSSADARNARARWALATSPLRNICRCINFETGLTRSVLEWDEQNGQVFVRRAGRYTSADVHNALFPEKPPKGSDVHPKEAIRKYIRKRHARG
jgi:hypothetical protein